MKKALLIILSFISINCMAQQSKIEVSKDSATGSLVFNGTLTYADLQNEQSFTWLKTGMDDYTPDNQYVPFLADHLKDYKLVIFLGTWCDDSHYWIPKLFKLMKVINYPIQELTMYGVDRQKMTKSGAQNEYNVKYVPTIILIKDGKEAGRITESAMNGLEADLKKIIEGK